MGKKNKNNENENVKKDLNEDRVKSRDNNVNKSNKSKHISIWSVILYLYIIGKLLSLSVLGYYIYKDLVPTHEMPKFDMNIWWGKNSTEPQDTSIRPYEIIFSSSMESEIRFLFEMYRRSTKRESFEGSAWTYGVNTEAFSEFYNYWIVKYDFRKQPKFLNKYEQFKTNIQGLDIHYIHVKPKVDDKTVVLPLLLLHGWPGSIREFCEAIPLLTTPRKGFNFVFEVIAPSLPGFIFSEAPSRPGLSPHQIAIIMRNLMQRIGHKHYYVQGGGVGHIIGSNMATIFPNEVLGFHTNMPVSYSKLATVTWIFGAIWPTYFAGEHAEKSYPLTDKINFYLEESGYLHLQSTKPDTIGIALQDSPAGLATYILDRFMIFTNPANKFEANGGLDKYFDKDKLLDNIMLYWISGSITTAMRLYKELIHDNEMEQILTQIPTPVPTWVLRLKHELGHTPDFVLKWKYPNLVGTTSFDFGGHFAAFERPEDFSSDVFKAVKKFLNVK